MPGSPCRCLHKILDSTLLLNLGSSRQRHDLRLFRCTRGMQNQGKVITCIELAKHQKVRDSPGSRAQSLHLGRCASRMLLGCQVHHPAAQRGAHLAQQSKTTFKGFPAACLPNWNKPATSCTLQRKLKHLRARAISTVHIPELLPSKVSAPAVSLPGQNTTK